MRMIFYVSFPTEVFNQAVRDGSVSGKMQKLLGDMKPEAAYFTDRHGERSAVIIADLPTAADIPRLVEPWFHTFNVKLEMHAVMTAQDLAASGMDRMTA